MFLFNLFTSCFNSAETSNRQITDHQSKSIRTSPSTLKNKVQKVQISDKILYKNVRAKNCCFHHDGRIATAFYTGVATVQTFKKQQKKEIIDFNTKGSPLRCVKFIERINCLVVGSDSCLIYVYDYERKSLVRELKAHLDYLR